MLSYLLMSVWRNQADGSHQLDGLQHDEGHRGGDGPGQEGQRLLVVEQVPQPDLVVHDRLQTLDTLQLYFVPFGITKNIRRLSSI